MSRTANVRHPIALLAAASLALLLAGAASAQSTGPIAERWEARGDRLDARFDRRGERIETRYDRRAERAADNGRFERANRLDARGDRIERHYDRRGDRLERRADRIGERRQGRRG